MKKFQRLVEVWMVLAALVAIAALLPLQLQAQTTYGSIVGMVTDASGAAVPGAAVTVTNLGTNESHAIKSDAAGNYSAVNLLPATYKVTVEAANFKRNVRSAVTVAVGATVRLDVALQVGAATETVEVTTQAALLQTDSGTMSTQVEGKTVEEMPLNGRNTMGLLALAAGVVPQGSTAGGLGQNQGAGHTMLQGWNNYQIGGTLAGESATYLDGAPVNSMGGSLGGNAVSMVMTQDAVQEFNVASSNVTADFGRFGGGVVNMASKGGTNKISGSVYEYFRNRILNANDWWNKRSESQQGVANKPLQWNQNQYGVALGGPIKKDKIFYHFTWEGYRSTTAIVTPTNVPTSNMQGGIIQGTLTPVAGCTYDTTTHPGYTTIPQTCWDPLAKLIKNYYPLPNNLSNPTNNYFAAPSTPNKQDQYNGRVDYNLGTNQRLFARYTYWSLADKGFNEFNNANGWDTENAHSGNVSQQGVLGDTYTFSPNTILDVRLSYLRDYSPSSQPGSLGTNLATTFPGTYLATLSNQMTIHELPVYGINSNYNLYNVGRMNQLGIDWFNTYSAAGSLTHIIGNHSLKIGAELRRMEDISAAAGTTGGFTFDGSYSGDAWADFLLGLEKGGNGFRGPNSGIQVEPEVGAYNYYQAYYATDAWQATRRLTLNLGIRWELPGGVYAKQDRNTVLLPTTDDPDHAGSGATLALVNSTLFSSKSSLDVKHGLFAPRVGIAYRLGNDMSVRGGYGLSYLPLDVSTGSFPINSPINQTSTGCGSGFGPHGPERMYDCFTAITPNPSRSSDIMAALGYYNNTNLGISGAFPNQKFPYVQQWNLSVGRQFKGNMMFEVGYVGAKGTNLPDVGNNHNQLAVAAVGQYGINLSSQPNPTAAQAALGATGTCGGGLSVGQCSRPYPHYGNVTDGLSYHASTVYHSLQVKGEKRFGSAGMLMGNFTWAKSIGDTDSASPWLETPPTSGGMGGGQGRIQNYDNMKAERSTLTQDVPYRAVISYVLTLPFGQGQKFGADVNSVVNHLISGWGVNGITTFQKGFHVPINDAGIHGPGGNADLGDNYGGGSMRPNYTAGCKKTVSGPVNSRINGWFNTACFQDPADFTFGTEKRVDSNIFDEGIENFDFSLLKTTKITEATNAQFRVEFFNIFNRKQFAPPDGQLNTSMPAFLQTFGHIQNDANQPRLIQLSLRVNF